MILGKLVLVSGAVEGLVDEAVLRVLIRHVGAAPGPIHGKHGKEYLRKNLGGYNQAARINPWVILVDLDQDADCPPPFRDLWLPKPATQMCFRVVVREIEAWLLADRSRIAQFLSISSRLVPTAPELMADPKHTMVALARRSHRPDIREEMVPPPGSWRKVGPAYNARLIEFVEDGRTGWRPEVAAQVSESLQRCLGCLRLLVRRVG